MWMKSRYATWEAEGQIEERIQHALCEGERWRLGQMAKSAKEGHNRTRFLASVSKRLPWLGRCVRGWLADRADAADFKPVPVGQSRGGQARAEDSLLVSKGAD
jgi:hypothetical protein